MIVSVLPKGGAQLDPNDRQGHRGRTLLTTNL
jgi:hypothetical protein